MSRTASGSDISRTWRQLLARKFAESLVWLFRLNKAGFVRTEFVQAIQPIVKVGPVRSSLNADQSKWDPLLFRCGHGRLLWRARTFYTDEPDTIKWLDSLEECDILWDVGANVGMYSIYASKIRGCRAVAFEPEAQNYAILVENIALNRIGEKCLPVSLAIAGVSGFGALGVRYVTKGGAWNNFIINESSSHVYGEGHVVEQSVFGATLDDLATNHGFSVPTHLKVDVDGLEPVILQGGDWLLGQSTLRSVLVEVDMDLKTHQSIPDVLKVHGFQLKSETRTGKEIGHQGYIHTVNMIFERLDV